MAPFAHVFRPGSRGAGVPVRIRRRAAVFAVVSASVLAVWMIASSSSGGGANSASAIGSGVVFLEKTGIRIERVALVGGGGILDLRYQIVDPDKAAIVHDRSQPMKLLHEESGTQIRARFHAHSSSGKLRAASTYFDLITNPGGVVERGDTVAVLVRGARLEGVQVR